MYWFERVFWFVVGGFSTLVVLAWMIKVAVTSKPVGEKRRAEQ